MTKKLGAVTILAKYFRDKSQPLKEFLLETKELSESDRLELARGAAKALDITQDKVEFSLDSKET
jgi:hypothetical protein